MRAVNETHSSMTSPSRPRQIASMPSASVSAMDGAEVMVDNDDRTVGGAVFAAEPTAVGDEQAALDASGLIWSESAGMLSRTSWTEMLWRGHDTAQMHGMRVDETCSGEGGVAVEESEEEPAGTSIEEGSDRYWAGGGCGERSGLGRSRAGQVYIDEEGFEHG